MLPLGFCRQAAKQKADPVESFSVNSVNNMDAAAVCWLSGTEPKYLVGTCLGRFHDPRRVVGLVCVRGDERNWVEFGCDPSVMTVLTERPAPECPVTWWCSCCCYLLVGFCLTGLFNYGRVLFEAVNLPPWKEFIGLWHAIWLEVDIWKWFGNLYA